MLQINYTYQGYVIPDTLLVPHSIIVNIKGI